MVMTHDDSGGFLLRKSGEQNGSGKQSGMGVQSGVREQSNASFMKEKGGEKREEDR